jgi:hypothetical protein
MAVCAMSGARIARAETAAGTIFSASGPVEIQRGGATLAAKPGTLVKQGDKIVVGAHGHTVIMLSDQSKLELRPSTTITIDEYTNGGATPTRIGLPSGILKSFVKGIYGSSANFEVRTPNAVGAVRGTDFYISCTQSSPELGNLPGVSVYTEVAVIEGTVTLTQLRAPDECVRVGTGNTATVPGDRAPVCHKRDFDHDHDRDHGCGPCDHGHGHGHD